MSTTENIDHTAEKNRSYDVRLRNGDRVVTLRPIVASKHDGNWENWEYVTVPTGTVLVARGNDTNAGFRGIEFRFNFGEGFSQSVSTGAVRFARVDER